MPRVPLEELTQEYERVLTKRNMDIKNAKILASTFAGMAWEGVYSHGVNRFPVFIAQVDKGEINLNAQPKKVNSVGVMEQWDCELGPGPLNAMLCVERAIELAELHGVGVVALKNSNHWMRGGTYPLHAARKGYASIAVTNSIAVMPAWGGLDHRIGTNPLIIGIPGDPPIVFDMSCSQYSYGRLQSAQLAGESLEVPGGYNEAGELSKDPNEIQKTKRILPAGYWKGAGLSIVLDMLVTLLSSGNSTVDITEDLKTEQGVSQLIVVFNTKKTIPQNTLTQKLTRIVSFIRQSELIDEARPVRIPGENIAKIIEEHKKNGGIPVDDGIWDQIIHL